MLGPDSMMPSMIQGYPSTFQFGSAFPSSSYSYPSSQPYGIQNALSFPGSYPSYPMPFPTTYPSSIGSFGGQNAYPYNLPTTNYPSTLPQSYGQSSYSSPYMTYPGSLQGGLTAYGQSSSLMQPPTYATPIKLGEQKPTESKTQNVVPQPTSIPSSMQPNLPQESSLKPNEFSGQIPQFPSAGIPSYPQYNASSSLPYTFPSSSFSQPYQIPMMNAPSNYPPFGYPQSSFPPLMPYPGMAQYPPQTQPLKAPPIPQPTSSIAPQGMTQGSIIDNSASKPITEVKQNISAPTAPVS